MWAKTIGFSLVEASGRDRVSSSLYIYRREGWRRGCRGSRRGGSAGWTQKVYSWVRESDPPHKHGPLATLYGAVFAFYHFIFIKRFIIFGFLYVGLCTLLLFSSFYFYLESFVNRLQWRRAIRLWISLQHESYHRPIRQSRPIFLTYLV